MSGQPPPPPEPARRLSPISTWFIVALGIALLITIGWAIRADDGGSENGAAPIAPLRSTTTTTARPSCEEVVYYVDGTATSVSLTLQNATGGTEQADSKAVPLANAETGREGLHIGCVPPGAFTYISAQNEGDSGTVECRIERDGRVVAQSSSEGAYVIATCSD